MGGTNTVMTFTELSGDPIPTKDLAIVTYYQNKNGTVYKNKQTATSLATDLYGYGSTTRFPFINDMRYGYSGNNPAKDFGNYTWNTGDVLGTRLYRRDSAASCDQFHNNSVYHQRF